METPRGSMGNTHSVATCGSSRVAFTRSLTQRIFALLSRPSNEKYAALVQRWWRISPRTRVPLRLPFGAWIMIGSGTIDRHLLWGSFERLELEFVRKFLEPGMCVLDIGAHHGLYTLLASLRVGGQGSVIAFEPSPREHRLLAQAVRLNFCSNVHLQSIALGRARSTAELFVVDGRDDGCNSLRPPAGDIGTHSVRVDIVPLDDFLAEAGIDRVDFVKLDVEGAERDVLLGASKMLAAIRPVILAEVQEVRTRPWGYRAREILEILSQQNYRWFQIESTSRLKPVPVDGRDYDANLVAIPAERASQILARIAETER